MKRTITGLALVAAALAAAPRQADAQASITATATVAGAITLTAGNDLDFQTVIPGYPKTVAVTDATAGTFTLTGGLGAEVSLTFTSLPANLSDGTNNLPITYTGVTNQLNDPSAGGGAAAFTPSAGGTASLDSSTGELYVFIGGTVTPGGAQVAGIYTGTVTLTAAYTGN